MKFNPGKFKKSAIASALILCGASVVAFAQSAPPPAGPQSGHSGMEHGMQRHQGLFMPRQMAALKTSLRLTPQQTALWEKAEKAMAPAPDARAKRQEMAKARHDQTLAALADPKFDPRKFAAQQEKQRAALLAENKARMDGIKEAWFTVYDSLDSAQRGQVREFLRARFEARAKTWRQRGAHSEHGAHQGGMRDGEFFRPGAAAGPMPAPKPTWS